MRPMLLLIVFILLCSNFTFCYFLSTEKCGLINYYVETRNIKFATVFFNDTFCLLENIYFRHLKVTRNKSLLTFDGLNHVTILTDDGIDNFTTGKYLIFTDDLQKWKNKFKNNEVKITSDVTLVYNETFYNRFDLMPIENESKYDKIKNLQGKVIKIAFLNAANKDDNFAGKITQHLLELLQDLHNITYKIHTVRSTDALLNLLETKKVDLTATAVHLTKNITQSFTPIARTYNYKSTFLFVNPGTFFEPNYFLSPLSRGVWIATLIATVIVMIALKISFSVEDKVNAEADDSDKINSEEGKAWSAVIFDTLSMIIQQGTTYEPHFMSGRVVLFTYLMLGVLLINYYLSVMVSNLLSYEPGKFPSLKDVGENMVIGSEDSDVVRYLFQETTDPLRKKLYQEKLIKKHNDNVAARQGVKNMRAKNYAFYTHSDYSYDLIKRSYELTEICDVNEMDAFWTVGLFLYTPKNSEYEELFKASFKLMEERSLHRRVTLQFSTKKLPCQANRDYKMVTMKQCVPLFYVLITGYLLAVVFFIIETSGQKKF